MYAPQQEQAPRGDRARLAKPAARPATDRRAGAAPAERQRLSARRLTLITFGFKYGQPNANYYFDVSFLKNPAREKRWGLFARVNDEMRRYLLDGPDCRAFLDAAIPLIRTLIRLDDDCRVGIGCCSGRHRSWIVGEGISRRLQSPDCDIRLVHREEDCL